jgi:hypothetical protein
MRALYLPLGLFEVLFCVACGSSSGIIGFIPQGSFSPASLKGQYVYQIEGFDFSVNRNGVPYREIGVFNADGNGVITRATDDFSEGSLVMNTVSRGTYTISSDGTGRLTFNNALGTIQLAVTLVSSSKVYLVEGDTVLNAGGLAEKQLSTAAPSGTFVFREHDVLASPSVARVGAFNISGGTVSSGNVDVNRGGTFSSLIFTAGAFITPDSATGRGSATLIDNSPASSSFIYYVVDANNLRLMASTLGVVGAGRAEQQIGTPALSGSYAFGSKGDTLSFLGGINTAGRFTAGGGSITAGVRDSVEDGKTATSVSFTGTFTQPANGRAAVSLTTATNGNLVVWMVSPSRGFFLVNDPNTIQDGTLDLQTAATFSNATMKGQYALVMDGFDGGGAKDRVGTLQWDGSGGLTLNEFTNAGGVITFPIILSGNYLVSSNGRTAASISNLSNNLVFYLISGSDAYVLQNDSGVQITGTLGKQN